MKPGSPPAEGREAPSWRSASEQQRFDPLSEPEFRRLSEWPVAPAAHQWRLSGIDQVSIALERIVGLRASPRDPLRASDEVPRRRSALVCGAAAPVAALMLIKGARRVEACQPGFEPLLVLCELDGDPSALGTPSFPALLRRQEVADVFADPDTSLDAMVWYDIGGARTFLYLQRLTEMRDAAQPECPIVRLQPCPTPEGALAELAAVRRERSSFLAAADELYRQVRGAIGGGGDVVAQAPLQRLLQGGMSVVWREDPHGPL